jgi:thiamine biosynthesis lipoprotein
MKLQILKRTAYLTAFVCLAAPAHADWVRRVTDGIMGTRITVELWADDEQKAERAIDAVLDEMRHIDDSMSTYKPTSEVSQVNAKAADGPMKISKELFDLLVTAKEYSVLTDGAFDITYASVGYMYDFRKHVHPDDAQIDKALPAVNFRHVLLDPKNQTVQFSQQGVRIDLGGIARATRWTRESKFCKRGASPGRMSPRAATAASSGIGSASPGWSGYATRARGRGR